MSDQPKWGVTPKFTKFHECIRNDATVYRLYQSGASLEDIIVEIVNQKNDLWRKLADQSLLLPKRLRAADGTTYVYHPPDDLIPLEILPPNPFTK